MTEAPLPAAQQRRVRVQGASSAGLALVLLLGLLGTSQPPESAPDRTIEGVAPPGKAVTAPPPAARRPLQARRQVSEPRRAARVAAAAPARRRRVAPPPAPPALRGRAALPAHGPMARRYERDAHGESLCPAGTGDTPLGLSCRDLEVRAVGSDHQLRLRVCPTTAARFELRFATDAEVDVAVLDSNGQPVWTWRPRTPFGGDGHVLVSEVGACWTWETSWGQVDDRGRPLPGGRYALQVGFLELEDPGTYTRSFEAR